MHRAYCVYVTNAVRVNSLRPIAFSKLTIIGSDNGLSPGRRQVIIWTNVGILLTERLGTHFGDFFFIEINIQIHIHIQEIPFENVVWKMV